MHQATIKQAFSCTGIGLHSGKDIHVWVNPAVAGSGIVFDVSLPGGGVSRIAPRPESVIATGMATTIGDGKAAVSTVEHMLAAVRGLGIDNLLICVEGGELPILDGSAAEWVRLLTRAGIERQDAPRRVLRVSRPLEIVEGDKHVKAFPYDGFLVDCTIEFPHPAIGRQHMRLEITPDTFHQIAAARTFGFLEQVEWLRSQGLALGGSLDNAVVIGPEGVLNEGGLRFADEFVRHKILDFVGDMAMLPLPVRGRFELCRSGHDLHNKLARALSEAGALQAVREAGPSRSRKAVHVRGGAWVAA